jgi:hypothetical protein
VLRGSRFLDCVQVAVFWDLVAQCADLRFQIVALIEVSAERVVLVPGQVGFSVSLRVYSRSRCHCGQDERS